MDNPGASFPVVQAARGLAALWVLLFHASEGHHIDALKDTLPDIFVTVVFDAGHYGVAVFFALSGFVIAHSLRSVEPSWAYLGRFALRRSIRLDPPYWGSMILVIAIALLSARVQAEPYVLPGFDTVAAHLLYAQVLLQKPAINAIYWTLTYEVQFYLFLAAALVLSRRAGARSAQAIWTGMTLLALASALGLLSVLPAGMFTELWAAFFAGVLGYKVSSNPAAAFAFALLVAVMLWSPAIYDPIFFRISAATAVLLALARRSGYIATGMNWSVLQFLGTISYSLYLLHNPITGAVGHVSRSVFGIGLWGAIITLALILVSCGLAAALFWRSLELTAHRLSRRMPLSKAAKGEAEARALAA